MLGFKFKLQNCKIKMLVLMLLSLYIMKMNDILNVFYSKNLKFYFTGREMTI